MLVTAFNELHEDIWCLGRSALTTLVKSYKINHETEKGIISISTGRPTLDAMEKEPSDDAPRFCQMASALSVLHRLPS